MSPQAVFWQRREICLPVSPASASFSSSHNCRVMWLYPMALPRRPLEPTSVWREGLRVTLSAQPQVLQLFLCLTFCLPALSKGFLSCSGIPISLSVPKVLIQVVWYPCHIRLPPLPHPSLKLHLWTSTSTCPRSSLTMPVSIRSSSPVLWITISLKCHLSIATHLRSSLLSWTFCRILSASLPSINPSPWKVSLIMTHPSLSCSVCWQEDRTHSHGMNLSAEKLCLESHVAELPWVFITTQTTSWEVYLEAGLWPHNTENSLSRPVLHLPSPRYTDSVSKPCPPDLANPITWGKEPPPKWSLLAVLSQFRVWFAITSGLWKKTILNSQELYSYVHLCRPAENISKDSCGRRLSPEHQHSAVRLLTGLGDQSLGTHVPWAERAQQPHKAKSSQNGGFWCLQEAQPKDPQDTSVC